MQNITKHNITDNINLYIIHDDKYKTVHCATFLHRPLSRDEATKNSLLAKVLRASTLEFPTTRLLTKYTQTLYGASYDVGVSKKANIHSIVSAVSTIADRFAGTKVQKSGYTLMLDLLFKPNATKDGFDKGIVSSQKLNLKDDIDGFINDKRSYANVRCLEEMCKGEPNAVVEIGYKEDIDSLCEKNLFEHYMSIIYSSPVDIFVVGDVCGDELVSYTKDYFCNLPFDISPIKPEFFASCAGDVKNIEDNLNVNQGKLVLGLRTMINSRSSDYYSLLTGNSIFGSGAHSKLFNNVREKLSLCYYAASRLDKYNGLMLVGSGIEFCNFEKAKTAILAELDNVRKGEFTDDELAVAKEYIISSYRSYNDSPVTLIDYYCALAFDPALPTLEDACEAVGRVTKDDVLRAFENVCLDTVYFLNNKEGHK